MIAGVAPDVDVPVVDWTAREPTQHLHSNRLYICTSTSPVRKRLSYIVLFFITLFITLFQGLRLWSLTDGSGGAGSTHQPFGSANIRDYEQLVRLVPVPISKSSHRPVQRHPVVVKTCDKSSYCIVQGYVERQNNSHFVDTFTDEWQDEVYAHAYNLASVGNFTKIVDVGCGSGYKLMKYFRWSGNGTIGLELEPTLSFLRKNYQSFQWYAVNETISIHTRVDVDLLMSADVIEHVVDPNTFMNFILSFNAKLYVLSSPERVSCRGASSLGPPENVHHVREWSRSEFVSYVGQFLRVLGSFTADTGTFGKENVRFDCNQWVVATRGLS